MDERENARIAREQQSIPAEVAGKRVLVTGAAGFLGSALTRFLADCGTEQLALLDIAESGLHALALELDRCNGVTHEEIVGDVCDAALLAETFQRFRSQIVLHFAACKHVPLMERNPFAAARTNVLGTRQVLREAAAGGVEAVVVVSTDKAVEPASMMGATKRIAELMVRSNKTATRMNAVRLGNVWGSTGSVVPILRQQIALDGPVTLTDPRCRRYFLPVDVAVRRILYALVLGRRSPANFVSEAGRLHSIEDVASELMREAGATMETRWIGLRPGEKLTERMIAGEEAISTEAVGGLYELVMSPQPPDAVLEGALAEIEVAVESRDLERLLRAVQQVVPSYRPSAALMAQVGRAFATSAVI